MLMRKRSALVWAFTLSSCLWMGCTGSLPSDTTPSETDGSADETTEVSDLQGTIVIDGSSTVYPISLQVTEEFGVPYPQVEVSVGLSGTGGGFEKFMAGSTDISDASRPVKPGEIAEGKEAMIDFVEIPVAYDGLTIVVNPKNDFVTQLSVEQLQKIFLDDQPAKTWQDVDPSWPAEEIKLFIPGTDSGTFDYFKEVVAGKDGNIRGDEAIATDENDNNLVKGVSENAYSLGFFGAAYFFANQDRLKAVPIVNPDLGQAVTPTPETIENGSYAPFGRPLFIYVSVASLERIEVAQFVNFYLENAPRIAAEVGYVALPEEIYELARKHVDEVLTGTHYLDAEGKKREGGLPEIYTEANLPQ